MEILYDESGHLHQDGRTKYHNKGLTDSPVFIIDSYTDVNNRNIHLLVTFITVLNQDMLETLY